MKHHRVGSSRHKPSSVRTSRLGVRDDHSSRVTVTDDLSDLPRELGGRLQRSLFGLAPVGLPAIRVTADAGALLPHLSALPAQHPSRCRGTQGAAQARAMRRRSTLCCTFLRVTPIGRYPALRPMELGLSSRRRPGTSAANRRPPRTRAYPFVRHCALACGSFWITRPSNHENHV